MNPDCDIWFIAGAKQTYQNKILYETTNCVNDYDETVNGNVLNEHSNAASRYFHTLIAGNLKWAYLAVSINASSPSSISLMQYPIIHVYLTFKLHRSYAD